MSLVRPLRCAVEGCYYNSHPCASEKKFLRKHLWEKHDEIELQDAAVRLGFINPSEKRWKNWLIDVLADFGIVSEN